MNEETAASTDQDWLFENDGYCACCRHLTTFRAHQEWLRDHYVCGVCGSIPRQRHLQAVLDDQFPGWEALQIHESSPSNDYISRFAQHYTSSQYLPEVALGAEVDGIRCESVEELTFADGTFDLVVTQDVLEHVFHPERAVAEIHRVLRPGGAHVFTTPKFRGLDETKQRARLASDGTVEHLRPAQYHGSPVGDHRALVTYEYGQDFEDLLSRWTGGTSVTTVNTVDRSRGIDAMHNEVYVIRKVDRRRPGRFAPVTQPARALVGGIGLVGGKAWHRLAHRRG